MGLQSCLDKVPRFLQVPWYVVTYRAQFLHSIRVPPFLMVQGCSPTMYTLSSAACAWINGCTSIRFLIHSITTSLVYYCSSWRTSKFPVEFMANSPVPSECRGEESNPAEELVPSAASLGHAAAALLKRLSSGGKAGASCLAC
eukprot:3725232-Amphidinium_carterae.1